MQHVQLAQELARSFNSLYSPFFPKPQTMLSNMTRVKSLRSPLHKMSKSDNQERSRINLTDSPDVIREKVRKAVTDCDSEVTYDPTARPGVSNLVSIYSAFTGLSPEEVCTKFQGKETVSLKDELVEVLNESLGPIREATISLESNEDYVESVLQEGARKAMEVAQLNLDQVKRLVGL